MLFACNSEEENFLEDYPNNTLEESSQSVQLRSSSICSDNFLLNGDFETIPDIECLSDIYSNYGFSNTGLGAFQLGCIPPWNCYTGTQDLIMPSWNWGDFYTAFGWAPTFWDNYNFTSNWAFACVNQQLNHSEGISQSIDLPEGDDINYCLSLDYSSTPFTEFGTNSNLNLEVRFEENVSGPNCLMQGNIVKAINFPVPFGTNYPTELKGENTFKLDGGQYSIVFQSRNSQSIISGAASEGIFYDNVSLTCYSDLLLGISYPEPNGCSFDFSPNIPIGTIPGATYHWDFGDADGSTSTSENPTFEYKDEGTYTVTLTIYDERGCCTTVTDEEVTCGDGTDCTYGICWEEMIAYQIDGITIEDPNGNPITLTFFPDPLTYGNCGCVDFYDHIVSETLALLDTELATNPDFAGLSYGTFSNDHPDATCDKGGYAYQNGVPGYFFTNSDFPILQFNVSLSNQTPLPNWGHFYTLGVCN